MPYRHIQPWHMVLLWIIALPFIACEAVRGLFCGERTKPTRRRFNVATDETLVTPLDATPTRQG